MFSAGVGGCDGDGRWLVMTDAGMDAPINYTAAMPGQRTKLLDPGRSGPLCGDIRRRRHSGNCYPCSWTLLCPRSQEEDQRNPEAEVERTQKSHQGPKRTSKRAQKVKAPRENRKRGETRENKLKKWVLGRNECSAID